MPYSSKEKDGKITVMKKDSGKIVGHTTPENYKGYMAALHIHEPQKMAEGGEVLGPDEEKKLNMFLTPQDIQETDEQGSLMNPKLPTQPVSPTPKLSEFTPAEDESDKTDERVADSHPGHTSDDLTNYIKGQERQVDKYGPEQEQQVLNSILKERRSLPSVLGQVGTGFADAVTRAGGGESDYQKQLTERQNRGEDLRLKAPIQEQEMQAKNLEAKQALEGMTSSSPLGKAKVAFLQPLLVKFFPGKSQAEYASMLQNPDATAKMIGIPADVFGKEVEAKMKAQELGLEGRRADIAQTQANTQAKMMEANIINQEKSREEEEKARQASAATEVLKGSKIPFFGPSHSEKQAAAQTLSRISQGMGRAGQDYSPDVISYAQKHGITPEQAQQIKLKRTGAQ